MDIISQLQAMILTIAAGMLLGLIFDFYRAVRGLARPRRWLTNVGDLLYWLVATAVVFAALLLGNWGELRLYVFLGLLAGVGAYYKWASGMAVRLLRQVLLLTVRVAAALRLGMVLAVVRPARFVLWVLSGPFVWGRRQLARLARSLAVKLPRRWWRKP